VNLSANILMIEDDKDFQHFTRILLSRAGYNIYCAENEESAFALLKDHAMQLVFVDYMLPNVNGISLFEKIRDFHKIPFAVLMSGLPKEEIEEQNGVEIFSEIIEKPFSSNDILSIVKKYTEKAN
jgi:DNA-binding response OmpR family regulator